MDTVETKVAVVGTFLKESFPGDEVLDADDFDHSCRLYRIGRGSALLHRVRVAREFLADHSAEEIVARLHEWKVAAVIKSAGAGSVLITKEGVKTIP